MAKGKKGGAISEGEGLKENACDGCDMHKTKRGIFLQNSDR